MLVRTSYGKQLNYISYLIVIYIYIFFEINNKTQHSIMTLNHSIMAVL